MRKRSDYLIVTNNPLVRDCLGVTYSVRFLDGATLRQVLLTVRDMVQSGHALYTHPLSGSVKPNETPYKSVLVSSRSSELDVFAESVISDSLTLAESFPKKDIPLTDKLLRDFQLIDYTLLCSALDYDAEAGLRAGRDAGRD